MARTYVAELRALLANPQFSDDDFLACIDLLKTSPEAFLDALIQKVNSRQMSVGEVLPEDTRNWNQLTAPVENSSTLSEFITDELYAERKASLSEAPRRAMRSIALSFCAPALVPIELFRTLEADTVLEMLNEATQLPDHFALTGAFEICGDWLPRDPRFNEVGEKLLDRLFADMERLNDVCESFGAAFILTAAHLGQHQELRRKPAFWRRLTTASHASLVVRALAGSSINTQSLFKWAAGVSGKAYYLSVYLDCGEEPRWLPDWLAPNFLIAGAFGRTDAVLKRLPEGAVTEGWTTRIETARKWMVEKNIELLLKFPAIGESSRRKQPAMSEVGASKEMYLKFSDEPSVDNIIRLAPAIFSSGFPPETVAPAAKLVAELRLDRAKWEQNDTQLAVSVAAYVAVQVNDLPLADAVAQLTLESASGLTIDQAATEVAFRLIECAAADPDQENGRKVLAQQLENLAFSLPAERVPDLYGLFENSSKHGYKACTTVGPCDCSRALGLRGVTGLGARHGLMLAETVPMPANNLSVVFRR